MSAVVISSMITPCASGVITRTLRIRATVSTVPLAPSGLDATPVACWEAKTAPWVATNAPLIPSSPLLVPVALVQKAPLLVLTAIASITTTATVMLHPILNVPPSPPPRHQPKHPPMHQMTMIVIRSQHSASKFGLKAAPLPKAKLERRHPTPTGSAPRRSEISSSVRSQRRAEEVLTNCSVLLALQRNANGLIAKRRTLTARPGTISTRSSGKNAAEKI